MVKQQAPVVNVNEVSRISAGTVIRVRSIHRMTSELMDGLKAALFQQAVSW